jgi:asparagine synthase (glutamine-hydrolysing)
MVNAMMHEPFYSSGTYVNESLNVWIGWVAHRESFADCMPAWNASRDVCVIFAGEDFADAADLDRIRASGHACDAGNASYLVHLYEELGTGFFQKLNGWFSGVIIDLRKREVVLFNDRYGLQRIYYHEHPSGFYFASEAKSLVKVLPELRELDLTSLAETFSCGCVLQNRTLFSKVALLAGGSKWTFTGSRSIRKDTYFSPEVWESQPGLRSSEYAEKLRETFVRILPKYLAGSSAMSLTGGLDGRMIMAWANPSPGSLPCYTFGGTYRDCADVRIARRLARLCGQSHETLVVGPAFLAEFPALAEKAVYLSDGTMDVTGSVELYANRMARGIAPVRLTGNYGSEIIRGNVAFRPEAANEGLLHPDFSRLVGRASATYDHERQGNRDHERQGNRLSFIAFKQVPWHHYSRLAVELSQLTPRSPYLDNEVVSLMYRAPAHLIPSPDSSLRVIAEGNQRLARMPTDRGVSYRPIPVISAGHHLYQEFTAKAEYAYDYGMPQWLTRLDRALSPLHLERLFLGRHKFYHFRVWYRDKLHQYLKDILLDPRARNRPYLDGRFLERMVNMHIQGKANYTSDIHRVLTAELFQRQLLEK